MLRRLGLLALALSACDRAPAPGAPSAPEIASLPGPRPDSSVPSAGGASSPPRVGPEEEIATADCKPGDTCIRFRELVLGGDATGPLPLVVAIHGLGDRPELFAKVFEGMSLRARVVLPRGIAPFRGGFRWMEHAIGKDDVAFAEQSKEIGARLAAATEALAKRVPVEGRPVVTGFSQGGMLAFYLATHHPKVFSRAVPVAGTLLPAQYPTTACKAGDELTPILAVHGTADHKVPIEGAEAAVKAIAALGCKATLQRVEGVAHAAPPPMLTAIENVLRTAIDEGRRTN